ncbi:hypothetical protein MUP59_09885 [Candidatus Bathyarchaeota archaeon]|nr:hypothetical protein [Candidatus Bathyarchaeota archaeon]
MSKDVLEKRFEPNSETDIQAYLYHLLLQNRAPEDKDSEISTEYPLKLGGKRSRRIDLAMLSKADKNNERQERLLIEIKETSRKPNKDVLEEYIEKDVAKLEKALNDIGKPHFRRPIQIFFYRNKRGVQPLTEIVKELDDDIEKMAETLLKRRKIQLFWGPRPRERVLRLNN